MNFKKFVKSAIANWDSSLLLIGAAISIFVQLFSTNTNKENSLILYLLSGIAVVIAIERFKHIEELKTGIEELKTGISNIQNALQAKQNFEIIYGSDNISKKADELIIQTKRQIRTTSFSYQPDDSTESSQTYFKLLANILKINKNAHNKILYQSVYRSTRDISGREKIFNDADVRDCVKLYSVVNPIRIEIMIIDDKYLFIAFPELGIDAKFRSCIFIYNEKEFITGIIDWYDNHLLKEGKEVKI